jgi:osmotically-inducible protein OsmY
MDTAVIPWIQGIPDHAGLLANGIDVPHGVSVTIRDGHLTLEGAVSWNYERVRAELAVKRLKGVRSVSNNILVKPGRR